MQAVLQRDLGRDVIIRGPYFQGLFRVKIRKMARDSRVSAPGPGAGPGKLARRLGGMRRPTVAYRGGRFFFQSLHAAPNIQLIYTVTVKFDRFFAHRPAPYLQLPAWRARNDTSNDCERNL